MSLSYALFTLKYSNSMITCTCGSFDVLQINRGKTDELRIIKVVVVDAGVEDEVLLLMIMMELMIEIPYLVD